MLLSRKQRTIRADFPIFPIKVVEYSIFDQIQRMTGSIQQISVGQRDDFRRQIRPIVCEECFAGDFELFADFKMELFRAIRFRAGTAPFGGKFKKANSVQTHPATGLKVYCVKELMK